ncbi:DMT family transporter [Cupriavidus basilensis]|uniref:DMT family transporter n=1 Tax=Cupriavidus basilensis TaxID=68895 RepID=A0A643FJ29_9BURK|nr:DMT family transporter [Cupriavidus basilensis]QOT76321.1 DMT family transporter [Cupriavidus basilensis]
MPGKRGSYLGYFYLTLAMVLVGSTVIASKVIASGLPPFTATALRFAIALPCLLGAMRLTGASWPRPRGRDRITLVVQAAAGSVGYTTLLISGLRLTSAADAGVIIGTLPVVSAVIAILLLGERPHRFLMLAIGLATAGIVMVAFPSGAGSGHSLLGNALVLGAVVCEGLFILLNRRLDQAIAPLALSALMCGIGLVASALFAVFEAPWTLVFSTQAAAAVIYYAIVPTVGGFLLWYAGSARTSGSEAALFTALAPVSAVVLAVVLLGERVSVAQVTGVGCVLLAVASLLLVRPASQGAVRGP